MYSLVVNNFMSAAFLTEDQKKNEIKKKKEAKQKKRDEKKRKEENSSVGIKPVNFTGDLSILNTLNTTQTPSNTPANEGKSYETCDLNTHMTVLESESLETDRFNTLGRRSPPMHLRESATSGNSGSSSPPLAAEMLPKRPQKPGAKSVRWTDQTGSKPLEQVREFEVIPDERGLSILGQLVKLVPNPFLLLTLHPTNQRRLNFKINLILVVTADWPTANG